jgi:hypothetical protein
VRRCATPVQHARGCQHERAGTNRGDTTGLPRPLPHPVDQYLILNRSLDPRAPSDEQSVHRLIGFRERPRRKRAVAFHTTLALKEGIDPTDVQAICDGHLPKDSKFAALSALAKTMIEKRGHLDDQDVEGFLAAGFGKDHLLEVIAAVAASTITNYTGSITKPPLDAPFQAHAWAA